MSVFNATGNRFERGWQPCNNFSPTDDVLPGGGNEHECFCRKNGFSCDLHVSHCRSCGSDHHQNGYESCGGCGQEWKSRENQK